MEQSNFDALIDKIIANLQELGLASPDSSYNQRMSQAGENLKRYQKLSQENSTEQAEFLKTLNDDGLHDMRMMNLFVKMQSDINSMELESEARLQEMYANMTAHMTAEERGKYIPDQIRNRYEPLNATATKFSKQQPSAKQETLLDRFGKEELDNMLKDMERGHLISDRIMLKVRENMAAKPEDRKLYKDLLPGILPGIEQEVDEILAARDQARATVQGVANERLKQDFAGVKLNQTQENIQNIKHMLKSGGKELTAENVDLALNKLNGRLQDNPALFNSLEQAGAALKHDLYHQNLGQSINTPTIATAPVTIDNDGRTM